MIGAVWKRAWFKCVAMLRLNRHTSHYLSCSQFGEDMIARSLLPLGGNGYYIDIRCPPPDLLFEHVPLLPPRLAWPERGRHARIDGLVPILRPRDKNLELCLAASSGKAVEFFLFDHPRPEHHLRGSGLAAGAHRGARLKSKASLRTVTLDDIVRDHVGADQHIDLLSIDIEGVDREVLLNYSYVKKPTVLVFESHDADRSRLGSDELVCHLTCHGYRLPG